MAWTYSGDPANSDLDQVRFLVGDTDTSDQLLLDAEIAWAITDQSTLLLAAALCLRTLANKFSKMVTRKVGDVSTSCSDMAKAFAARADELDPNGITKAIALALPSFGGLTISGKADLDADSDAVQPSFSRGMNDYPGGFPDGVNDDDDWAS